MVSSLADAVSESDWEMLDSLVSCCEMVLFDFYFVVDIYYACVVIVCYFEVK